MKVVIKSSPLMPAGEIHVFRRGEAETEEEVTLHNPADADFVEWMTSGTELTFDDWARESSVP
jgi:hypothetical protein